MRFLPRRYCDLWRSAKQYWRAYGGVSEVILSPYLHAALICTFVSAGLWFHPGWWSVPLGVLPSITGFTLGGYAILMSFGNTRFQEMIRGVGVDGSSSPFIGISGTFAHFVLMQITALILIILLSTRPLSSFAEMFPVIDSVLRPGSALRTNFVRAFWGFGFFVFIYSIILSIAATLAIFRLSAWYDQMPPESQNQTS